MTAETATPDDFVELGARERLLVDLHYASANNFLGRNVYGTFDRLVLHPIAASKLKRAAELLASERSDLRLLVWDGFRPNRVQRLFWAAVEGTPQERYVGHPATGSIHGYGLAVDLTLATAAGVALDMGTDFDDFSPLAEPRLEARFLAEGRLTAGQVGNRHRLRDTMMRAGFTPLAIEWWHYDALPAAEVRSRFRLIE